MNHAFIYRELERNATLFRRMLEDLPPTEYLWKPADKKWCLLEVICHLYDEEREDFRVRLQQVLEHPDTPLKPIDPEGWVMQRNYIGQHYTDMLENFLKERRKSITWLHSLREVSWDNTLLHPEIGSMSGNMFLANWLEHDLLHMRQILNIKHLHLQAQSGQNLTYAGNW